MRQPITAEDFVRRARDIAYHFGFSTIDVVKGDPACKEHGARIERKDTAQDRKNDSLFGLLSGGMATYFDNKLNAITGPVLFYSIEHVPRSGEPALVLQVFNVKKSIAEALLIQTTRSLLHDLDLPDHMVRVNSLGDQESIARYIRDLSNFLKKRIEDLPSSSRELLKEHPIRALMDLLAQGHEIAKKSPNPLEYLSDQSRKHFREIVEFLDISGIPFEIDSRLIGHHDCYSDALFSVDVMTEDENPPQITIRGGRYSMFVSKMSKVKTPAVGAVIILKSERAPDTIMDTHQPIPPSAYMVQLGFRPKIRSLALIEDLKRSGIVVYQNVMSDSLSEQLREAEQKNARFAIIMGQKEYVDGNVIVRDLKERSQENIKLDALPGFLKRSRPKE